MSATPSLGRVVSKIQPNITIRYLTSLSSSPLALTTIIARNGSNVTRSFSGATTVPALGHTQRPDVPSERVLSRLSDSGLWREMPDTHTEPKQELGLNRGSEEAQRQQKEEAQKTAQRQEQEKAQKDDGSHTTSGIFPLHVAGDGGGVGGGDWTTGDQNEHEDHGNEDADTGTGSEASVPDYSSGYNGGCDGVSGWGVGGW